LKWECCTGSAPGCKLEAGGFLFDDWSASECVRYVRKEYPAATAATIQDPGGSGLSKICFAEFKPSRLKPLSGIKTSRTSFFVRSGGWHDCGRTGNPSITEYSGVGATDPVIAKLADTYAPDGQTFNGWPIWRGLRNGYVVYNVAKKTPKDADGMVCKTQQLPSTEGGDLDGINDVGAKPRQQCMDLCVKEEQCTGFAWKRNGKNCHLKVGGHQGPWLSNGKAKNYDFCYKSTDDGPCKSWMNWMIDTAENDPMRREKCVGVLAGVATKNKWQKDDAFSWRVLQNGTWTNALSGRLLEADEKAFEKATKNCKTGVCDDGKCAINGKCVVMTPAPFSSRVDAEQQESAALATPTIGCADVRSDMAFFRAACSERPRIGGWGMR